MITIGLKINWKRKSESVSRDGVVAQWRPNPDRVEIVPNAGLAYGEWVEEKDLDYAKQNKKGN